MNQNRPISGLFIDKARIKFGQFGSRLTVGSLIQTWPTNDWPKFEVGPGPKIWAYLYSAGPN